MMGNPSRVKVTGPLVGYAAGFREALGAEGYRPNSVSYQLQLLAHVSRWMASEELQAGDLTPECVEQFLVARRKAGYTLWLSAKGTAPLLAYLRRLEVVPVPEPAGPETAVEHLLEDYRAYLCDERGLAASTVRSDLDVARLFLSTRAHAPTLGLEKLTAGEVTAFVLSECGHRRGGSAKYVVTGLRTLLRFLFLVGLTPHSLAEAVPPVAGWRLASLPRALDPSQVAGLLASCDRSSALGRRDFAVLTLLVRLGLRAGEVAALELADIDWHAGELLIRGKGPKQERLPLPVDVGEAIVGWLRRGRPRCACRAVFTRIRAPHRGLSRGGVSAIVSSACRRAGLPEVNAHRLRHTAATEMLRAGAPLAEVGQVLRHTSLLTTSIYAKVDRSSLSALAQPWLGGGA
jgi:site-specific recombinase XerD